MIHGYSYQTINAALLFEMVSVLACLMKNNNTKNRIAETIVISMATWPKPRNDRPV
jgi:hypothetical protein